MLSRKPRPRKCAWCSGKFTPRQMGQKACSPKCALAHTRAQAAREAHRAKPTKQHRTLSGECALTQRYVNQYVRIRDAGRPCISCGAPNPTEAGHRFPIGSKYRTSRFRWDVRQIHLQCHQCNAHMSGNTAGYDAGLVARYGQAYLDAILAAKSYVDTGQEPRLTKEECRQIAAGFRAKIREIKEENK